MIALPNWTDSVLQGLAHWIGYKKQLYRGHLINEGAIVSETAHLINGNLKNGESLVCEEGYGKMIKGLKGKLRADLAIYEGENLQCVIEVKREEAGSKLIGQDLDKLMEIKKSNPDVGCYLLLVSQGRMPRNYVTDTGTADISSYCIGDTKYLAKARRVCKSTSSFKLTAVLSANYACLIEVYK